MASAAKANRLKLTLDSLIHEYQKGFCKMSSVSLRKFSLPFKNNCVSSQGDL